VRTGKFARMAIAIFARNGHRLAAQVDAAPPAGHFPAAFGAAIRSIAKFPREQLDFSLCKRPNLGPGRFSIAHFVLYLEQSTVYARLSPRIKPYSNYNFCSEIRTELKLGKCQESTYGTVRRPDTSFLLLM
jgi:hypothetical protein